MNSYILLENKKYPDTIVILSQISKETDNKTLYDESFDLNKFLFKRQYIEGDKIIIYTFIKHFSRSTKNFIMATNKELTSKVDKELRNITNANKIIKEFILHNVKNNELTMFMNENGEFMALTGKFKLDNLETCYHVG